MVQARENLAAFLGSPQGQGMLIHGRVPVESTPLLHALRDAVHGSAPADDGTVLLSEVLEKLHALHPNEKPEHYGYKSWPQVIHESRWFGMVRRDAEGRKAVSRVRLLRSPDRDA